MAAPSAGTSLGHITLCSICLGTWEEPRSLPDCDHIFCLQCLKTLVQNSEKDGEDTKCPVCRKEFNIPEGGLDKLPKNHLHQQLLDARSVSKATVASVDPKPPEEIPACDLCMFNITASGYCVECDQNLCKTCTLSHPRARACKNHKVVGLEDKKKPSVIKKLRSSYCQQHREERVKLYCDDCQKPFCTICLATEHLGHKCAAIDEAAQIFVDRVKACHVSVQDRIGKTEGYLAHIDKNRNEFLDIVSDKENQLQEKEQEIMNIIQSERVKLRNELKEIKEKRLKEISMNEEEIKTELLALKSFMKTSKELLDKGSASDICRSTNDLLAQGDVLVKPQTDSRLACNRDQIDINFIPTMKPDVNGCEVRLLGLIHYTGLIDIDEENSSSQNQKAVTLDQVITSLETKVTEKDSKISSLENYVKEKDTKVFCLEKDVKERDTKISSLKKQVKDKDHHISCLDTQLKHEEEKYRKLNEAAINPVRSTLFLSKSTVVRVIPGADKGRVYGIAVLGSELFIARHGGTSLEVYDANNIFATPRQLKISDEALNSPRLATCPHYNCLYVRHSAARDSVMYRVEISNSSVSSWIVCHAHTYAGFSITNDHTVLVTLYNEQQVQEYTTDGELIREIRLDSSISSPRHCIQLSDGNFAICHIGSQHRVCILDTSGRIIKSYGGSPGSGAEQLNNPFQLSVDKHDHVFVPDCHNNRVQLLSPALTLRGTVQIPGHQLNRPVAQHFDQINHRLYVNRGSDVIVVELQVAKK